MIATNLTVVDNLDIFDEMYNGSYYTILGCGESLDEWIENYEKWLKQGEIGIPKNWYKFTGKQMNDKYGLYGNVAYPKDLICLSFPLDGLNTGKLAIFKIEYQDRWFDDIVDNNKRHMEE